MTSSIRTDVVQENLPIGTSRGPDCALSAGSVHG